MKVTYLAPENSGVAYYRFHQPLEDLKEKGLIELKSWGFDFTTKRYELPTFKELKELSDWTDIFIVGRRDDKAWLFMLETLKAFSLKPILLDIDDNIYKISPYLAAYQQYLPDGEPIKIHEKIAQLVNGIIVTTQSLKDIYDKFNKVYIVPNSIKYLFSKKPHSGVNIGYIVSASHLENAQIIEGAIIKILLKYDNVKFFYTRSFSGFMDLVPETIKNRINYLPFFPLDNYLKYVNNLSLDIGLAPLMDNDFNKCKSNLRILEYWQNQIAVIASEIGEYRNTLTHGYDGYFSANDAWEFWLDDLIQNPTRRQYFIKNSLDTLKKYDVSISSEKYYKILREFIGG